MIQTEGLLFETEDNFQKQTYRNRCLIFGPNGKQLLNIPIQKVSGKQKTKDVKINYSENWQQQHLKALNTAYSSSPFYEFYIDDLRPIFQNKETFLLDLNIITFELLSQFLQIEIPYNKTEIYQKETVSDYRELVNAKKSISFNFPKYTQVFSDKHGFLKNLSILDLLFMEGPNALTYLKKLTS